MTETGEIDIKEIGAEGQAELDRAMIDFEAELKALPKKTSGYIAALCKRKMGESDYKSFFMDNDYNMDLSTYTREERIAICEQLIVVCKARE